MMPRIPLTLPETLLETLLGTLPLTLPEVDALSVAMAGLLTRISGEEPEGVV